MPRPIKKKITFTLDGREVEAVENEMLVDAAKKGDVEIPVFCYEPKLGQPVGACRMCLVEIEGIPKLQTGCSTPVKDGMVVHTQTDRVQEAQRAVVEFLLVNHPLDCPVCDKGGECPLQDITFGWGPGKSRFVEPKRHFEKPLELSPLVAIDRERCILCYRCVRYSQEISEDYQLILLERGADSFVGTFDGHPYVAPFSGNIIELCPVGALTSTPYRFRARPWDIEQSGSVCTLCPSQCNVSLTVRDDKVMRVLARDNHDVDDGWLCDKGRFAYQANYAEERITQPLIRDGGELRPTTWENALQTAAAGIAKAHGRVGALVGGETSNEEAFLLQRLMRETIGSGDIDSRPDVDISLASQVALDTPALQATVTDIEFAHSVLIVGTDLVDEMPIVDLRVRKGVRRNGVQLTVATSRPTTLDGNAVSTIRFAPGNEEAFLTSLAAVLQDGDVQPAALAAGAEVEQIRALADSLRENGQDIVIVYGEDVLAGPGGENAAKALLNIAEKLGLSEQVGAGLLHVPSGSNGRGLREVGALPNAAMGLAPAATSGRSARAIAEATANGDVHALYLLHADPLGEWVDRPLWENALNKATTVVAHATTLNPSVERYATVVFPAETYTEKEGTITHPDGRIQRLRPAVGHSGETHFEWQVIAELSKRLGGDLSVLTSGMATAQLADSVSFYDGLTLEEIGGQGVRWQDRPAATNFPSADLGPFELLTPQSAPSPNGKLRLGSYRPIWTGPEVTISPALQFARATQRIEISPEDAGRLGISDGAAVSVSAGDQTITGTADVRSTIPTGSIFVAVGVEENSGNALTNGQPRLAEVSAK